MMITNVFISISSTCTPIKSTVWHFQNKIVCLSCRAQEVSFIVDSDFICSFRCNFILFIQETIYMFSVFLIYPITKTSPCNEHPLTPHFYIVKVGFTGVFIFFLFLL